MEVMIVQMAKNGRDGAVIASLLPKDVSNKDGGQRVLWAARFMGRHKYVQT